MIDPNKHGNFTNTKTSKLDRLLPLLKGIINMLLFLLCGVYSLTDMGNIDDVWFVLFMLTMLRLVEGVDNT
jgi:hypothetical protein